MDKKQIILLVDENYEKIGPEKSIVEGFSNNMPEEFQVLVYKMPISFMRRNNVILLNRLKKSIYKTISDRVIAVIPISCTICFYSLFLFRELNKKNIQIIAHMGDCNLAGIISAKKKRKELQKRQSLFSSLKEIFRAIMLYVKEDIILKKYKKAIYITNNDIKNINKYHKSVKSKIYLVKYGIQISRNIEKRLNKEELVIGAICTFNTTTYEDYFETFFEQCKAIKKNIPYLQIVIAGRNASESQIMKMKKYDFVNYIGEVEDIRDFYNSVDIVFTTVPKTAGILTKIIEAFAYGKCVIGYRENFLSIEEAKPFEHYIPANTEEEFLEAFHKCIENSSLVCDIGNNAKALVREYYTWSSQCIKLKECIEE